MGDKDASVETRVGADGKARAVVCGSPCVDADKITEIARKRFERTGDALDRQRFRRLEKIAADGDAKALRNEIDNLPRDVRGEVRRALDDGRPGVAPRGKAVGPDDAVPDGFSYDIDNPKYRQLKYGDRRFEYSVDGGKLSVDYVEGGNAASLFKEVVEAEGPAIRTIEGYATSELGRLSDEGLLRYGRQVARQLGGQWSVSTRTESVKRFLVFTR